MLNQKKILEREKVILFREARLKYTGFQYIEYKPEEGGSQCFEKDLTDEYFRKYVSALITRDHVALRTLIKLFELGRTWSV